MENVFALTTVEKRKGVERAKTTGHQPGLRKRVDAGACPLPTRHARQTVWFLCEEKRKKRGYGKNAENFLVAGKLAKTRAASFNPFKSVLRP